MLCDILESQRQFYNAALQERIDCYQKTGKTLSFFDQCNSLTLCRAENPEMKLLPNCLQRGTLKALDIAYRACVKKRSQGIKTNMPRFKGRNWTSSFGFDVWNGIRLIGNRIKFKGMPSSLRVMFHRPLPNRDIKSCQFVRSLGRWYVCLQVEVEPEVWESTGKSCGIDLGIENFATLDNGDTIPSLERLNVLERRKKKVQRKLARCKRGSNNRKKVKESLSRASAKIKNSRKTWHRQIASKLFKKYDTITAEKLETANMLDKEKNHKGLNRSIANQGWGAFLQCLTEKAESAARQLILVDPAYTSQTCPSCGKVEEKALSQRLHACSCGYKAHRDVAAARVIKIRGAHAPNVGVVIGSADTSGISCGAQKSQFSN